MQMRKATDAACTFDIMEAFVSATGLGDDINGMVRVCPPPRPDSSEVACHINSGMLMFWVGNLAS